MVIKNYGDLENYLLAAMNSFDDEMCNANKGISKKRFWDICMQACISHTNKNDVPNDLIIKNVLREFPKQTV